MTLSTQINLRTLKAVNLATSTEQARPYLVGVLVECRESTVTYVATDGHRALVVQEDLPELEDGQTRLVGDFIIPSAVIKATKVAKGRFAAYNPVTLECEAPKAAKGIMGEQVVTFVDATFPDWRRVCPAAVEPLEAGGAVAQFNANYVGMFGKFAEAMTWSPLGVHFHHTKDEKTAVAVTFGESRKAFGILMPVRASDETWTGRPDWTAVKPTGGTDA